MKDAKDNRNQAGSHFLTSFVDFVIKLFCYDNYHKEPEVVCGTIK